MLFGLCIFPFVSQQYDSITELFPTQARFLAGAIVAVGRDQMTVADVERLLERGERTAHDHTGGGWECAPAHALQLHNVEYDNDNNNNSNNAYSPIDWQTATV